MQNYSFTEDEIRQQLLAFMRSYNLEPVHDEFFILDGDIHRYKTKDDKNSQLSGSYCIHNDGLPAGWVQDWRKGEPVIWKFDTGGYSDELKSYFNSDAFRKKAEDERRRNDEIRAQKHSEATEKARITWDSLQAAQPDNSYLKAKKVFSYGLRFSTYSNALAVPLRDISGKLLSLQWIAQDGQKKYFHGAPLDGAFFSIALDTIKDNPDVPILIGEGYATMAKIYELTGYPCVAAKDCGSLLSISKIIHDAFPHHNIIITADDDKGTEIKHGYNPGLRDAQNTVKRGYAKAVISPPFSQQDYDNGLTDWDDFAMAHGDEVTAELLIEKIKRVPLDAKQAKYRELAEQLGVMKGSNFADFCTPNQNDNWLIQDWLQSESLMMLFAPSGSGKGFIALDIAFAVACPHISMWNKNKVLKHGPVVYLAGEGQRGLKKRCAGLAQYKGINTKDVDMHILSEAVPLDDKAPELGVKRIIANIGMLCPNPSLIFIDTANRYMAGDENKTADATAFIRACTEIMNEFQCSVVIIHHTGQAQETQGRARGSSVFKAAMDMEFKVSKSGSTLTLEMTKSKDTELQKPLVFQMKAVAAPGFFTTTGEQESTCILQYDEKITSLFAENNTPKGKMTKSEIFARDTYAEAAGKFGFLVHDSETNKEIIAVSLEDWRKVFYQRCAAEKDNAKRAQFSSARKMLLEERQLLSKRIMYGIDYYCLIPMGEAYETDILVNIHQRKQSSNNNDLH